VTVVAVIAAVGMGAGLGVATTSQAGTEAVGEVRIVPTWVPSGFSIPVYGYFVACGSGPRLPSSHDLNDIKAVKTLVRQTYGNPTDSDKIQMSYAFVDASCQSVDRSEIFATSGRKTEADVAGRMVTFSAPTGGPRGLDDVADWVQDGAMIKVVGIGLPRPTLLQFIAGVEATNIK
jgi:hypothetical protein